MTATELMKAWYDAAVAADGNPARLLADQSKETSDECVENCRRLGAAEAALVAAVAEGGSWPPAVRLYVAALRMPPCSGCRYLSSPWPHEACKKLAANQAKTRKAALEFLATMFAVEPTRSAEYRKHAAAVRELHVLEARGKFETPEADAIRDRCVPFWRAMSPLERTDLTAYSRSLDACVHESFAAGVTVQRVLDGKGGPPRLVAEVKIACTHCGLPFRFLGLPGGLDLEGAAVSGDGEEGRFSIAPLGQVLSPVEGGPAGFTVRRVDPPAGGP